MRRAGRNLLQQLFAHLLACEHGLISAAHLAERNEAVCFPNFATLVTTRAHLPALLCINVEL